MLEPRDLTVRVYIGAWLYKLKYFILKRFQIVVNKPETVSGDPVGNIRLIVIP
jgi:hypothetical protein